MSELEILISVLGTLGGVLVGYWTNSRIEARRRKHEIEMEYRREIVKHMDDIVKPLFHLIEELWGSLATLWESVRMKSSIVRGRNLKDLLLEVQTAKQNLREFILAKSTEIDLLMPHSLSTWVFAPIEERVDKILVQISEGTEPLPNETTVVINALMKYQKNVKKLIGLETRKKLEDIYPFT